MPDLMERIYCSEQIHVPPTFPYIMKLYCKAAIRTQPYDLLRWSAAYFRALANGEEPPVKERVEYPPYDSPSGLTPGYIKILINQFGKDTSTTVTAQTLFRKWSDICLDEYLLVKLIALLGANTAVNWVRFVGVCAGFISKTLTQTMILICELFTEEPEGGMATIPYELFIDLYMFLAQMECGPLTDEEKANLDAIICEEDICNVADKIKRGIYEGEAEGEVTASEEQETKGEEAEEEWESEKEKSVIEEETYRKETEEVTLRSEEEAEARHLETSNFPDEKAGSQTELLEEQLLDEKSSLEKEENGEDSAKFSELSFEGSQRIPSVEEGEVETPIPGEEFHQMLSEASIMAIRKEEPEELATQQIGEGTVDPRKINLEDLEESIRVKIEEKLAEEEETELVEEDKELENLSSYLLGAAARVPKYTAEALGFKIFRRFMRQEVPGIGPQVDTEQIEKVVDFMDSWAYKQEVMVMPRNIRHWMCPPLDKVPTPQP